MKNTNVVRGRTGVTTWPKVFTADGALREVVELAAFLVPRLLAGDHPTMAALRKQYERARISRVEVTGADFFVDYEVPEETPRALSPDLTAGDVKIQVDGASVPSGCVLFVRKGRLATFEGTTLATG